MGLLVDPPDIHLNRGAIGSLMRKYAPDDAFISEYEALLVLEGHNWFDDWFPAMKRLDERIEGVGLHWLQWDKDSNLLPWYPRVYSGGWDALITPLSEFPRWFWEPCPAESVDEIAFYAIRLVDKCLMKVAQAIGLDVQENPVQDNTMAELCSDLEGILGQDLGDDLEELNRWYVAAEHLTAIPKSEWREEHRIDLAECVGLYYVSRLLGAEVLRRCEGLADEYYECASKALADVVRQGITRHPPCVSLTPWSIVNPHPTYAD